MMVLDGIEGPSHLCLVLLAHVSLFWDALEYYLCVCETGRAINVVGRCGHVHTFLRHYEY